MNLAIAANRTPISPEISRDNLNSSSNVTLTLNSSSNVTLTPLILQIKEALERIFPSPNPLWNFSSNNTLKDNWLLATPSDVWGKLYADFKKAERGELGGAEIDPDFLLKIYSGNPFKGIAVSLTSSVKQLNGVSKTLIEGHSYQIYERMYNVMTSAEKFLDFTTLTPPTGRFFAAFKNAISYISSKPLDKRPVIRILYSSPVYYRDLDPKEFLNKLSMEIEGLDALPMEIYATRVRFSTSSWNHSKIVAADGVRALVGGHNFWGDHYLDKNPVFDVSMELSGSGALHAHDYANRLWDYAGSRAWCPLPQWSSSVPIVSIACSYASYKYNPLSKKNEIAFNLPSSDLYQKVKSRFETSSEGNISVLSAGRGGDLDSSKIFSMIYTYLYPNKEPSNEAFIMMIRGAAKNIWFSLQAFRVIGYVETISDLPPVKGTVIGWNNALFLELGKAVQRGVEIKAVLSNPNAFAGGLGSSAPYGGEQPSIIYAKLRLAMTKHLGITDDNARVLIKKFVSIGSFRYSSQEDCYPKNQEDPPTEMTPISNHAKTIMVDNQLFYIGSQNQYLSNVCEFGYFVESADKAEEYKKNYWDGVIANANWEAPPPQEYDLNVELQEKAEAVDFLSSLNRNTRLRESWERLLEELKAEKNNDNDREKMDQMLDNVITNAGFLTTVSSILEVSQTPFYQKSANYTSNDESDRFVIAATQDRKLLLNFTEIVTRIGNSEEEEINAINQFLKDKEYACNLFQVQASFEKLRHWIVEHWQGKYNTWLYTDNGEAFFPPNISQKINLLAAETNLKDLSSSAQIYQGSQLTITNLQNISLDGEVLVDLSYKDGTLSWSSEKNTTSGELTFGEVTRPGLHDSFTGREFFGKIVYPDKGPFPKSGIQSIYGRHSEDISSSEPKDGDPYWWKILAIIGGSILCFSMCMCAGKCYRRLRGGERDGYERLKQDENDHSEGSLKVSRETATQRMSSAEEPSARGGAIELIRQRTNIQNHDQLLRENKPLLDKISDKLKWDHIDNSLSERLEKHAKKTFEETNRAEEGSLPRLEMQITDDLLHELRNKLEAFVSNNTKNDLNQISTDPDIQEVLMEQAIIQPKFEHYKERLSNPIHSTATKKYGEFLADHPNQIRGETGSQIANTIGSAKLVNWQLVETTLQKDVSSIANDALESFDDLSDVFQMDTQKIAAEKLNTEKFQEIIQEKCSQYVDQAIAGKQKEMRQELSKLDLFKQLSSERMEILVNKANLGEVVAHSKYSEMSMSTNGESSYLTNSLESAVLRKKSEFLNQPDNREKVVKQISEATAASINQLKKTSEEIEATQRELAQFSDQLDKNPHDVNLRDNHESLEQQMEKLVQKEREIQDEVQRQESAAKEVDHDHLTEQDERTREKMTERGRDIFKTKEVI